MWKLFLPDDPLARAALVTWWFLLAGITAVAIVGMP